MEREHLLNVLQSNKNINLTKHEGMIDGKYNRIFEFEVRGKTYQIEWWVNVSYLSLGELTVVFDDISIDGCWPNRFKNNINFLNQKETIAVLPLEEYAKTNQWE
ncbi:hypothetical protein [Paraliobacillus ryukyuensis]|uniref:hypothetical protein n=1 Tax=Paraliobacillus ryukyuensis TaxID=200904 RepID=UPI000DE82AF8|nr:hypothetical protein [Paraliobacillus ryukyuensis]